MFCGTSENVLRIQIWTAALSALQLPRWVHHWLRASWRLSTLASMVSLNLFTYRALLEWLHDHNAFARQNGQRSHDSHRGQFLLMFLCGTIETQSGFFNHGSSTVGPRQIVTLRFEQD